MFFNLNPPRLRTGYTIEFKSVNATEGDTEEAVVTGFGRNKGRRIVYVGEVHWCYATDVVRVVRRQRRPKKGEK